MTAQYRHDLQTIPMTGPAREVAVSMLCEAAARIEIGCKEVNAWNMPGDLTRLRQIDWLCVKPDDDLREHEHVAVVTCIGRDGAKSPRESRSPSKVAEFDRNRNIRVTKRNHSR